METRLLSSFAARLSGHVWGFYFSCFLFYFMLSFLISFVSLLIFPPSVWFFCHGLISFTCVKLNFTSCALSIVVHLFLFCWFCWFFLDIVWLLGYQFIPLRPFTLHLNNMPETFLCLLCHKHLHVSMYCGHMSGQKTNWEKRNFANTQQGFLKGMNVLSLYFVHTASVYGNTVCGVSLIFLYYFLLHKQRLH